jgi:hypothetical protein
MKKTILILATTVFFCSARSQGISAGLKGGVNITNFRGDFGNVDKQSMTGFHAGGFLNFRLLGISLQPELLISTAGAKLDDGSSYKLTYLAMPVMLKYRMLLGLYFEAGPQFSYKLGENAGDKTMNNFAKDLDLSAAIGAGIQTKKGLGVGLRYLAGLSKVGDFEATDVLSPDFKNSVLQVGISFPLGK